MKQFLRNTLINVSAIGVTGLVGLMLVPIIVSSYGLESLGLIVLARILLPTSILGLLDLGTAEATTRFVASSAAEEGREKAVHSLIASLAIVLPIAACIAVTGGLAATWVTESVLGISEKHTPLMQGVVMWTCLAAVVTFPGMVCEGALRGLERYDVVRTTEVVANLGYAGATLAVIHFDGAYVYVAYAFLAAVSGRYLFFMLYLSRADLQLSIRDFRMSAHRPLFRLSWNLLKGKLLSHLLHGTAPILISHFVGAAGVGLFDAIVRIPRFAKTLVGLINIAVLPISARLEAKSDETGMIRFLDVGTRISIFIAVPPLFTTILFADGIFAHWIGSDFVRYSGYFALMLLWPLAVAVAGFGNSMMVARTQAVARLNLIAVIQLAIFFGSAFALIADLAERAFLVATVLGVISGSTLQLLLLHREYALPPNWLANIAGRTVLAGMPALCVAIGLRAIGASFGSAMLVPACLAVTSLYWLALLFVLFRPEERGKAFGVLGEIARQKG